jgi:uncharacterized protein (DUF58 family)
MQPHYTIAEVGDNLDARQFDLVVKRLADNLSYGTDPSRFLGSGFEYVQSRNYVPGDSIKSIDWKVTARTGRFHVKEYEATKRIDIHLVLDTSASMCIGSGRLTKYAWAVQLATGLALAAQKRLSPAGLHGAGTRDLRITPTLAQGTILQAAHRLRRYRPDEATMLGLTLRKLLPSLANRCLVIVISDFHDPDAVAALKLLGQRHDVLALHLQDPAERGDIGGGIFRAEEAETGTSFVTHGSRRWTDPAILRRELLLGGVDHLLLPLDQPIVPRLRHFLKYRSF